MLDSSSLDPEDCIRLVRRAKQGDPQAYDRLCSLYGTQLEIFLTNMVGNAEDARDITQEALIKGWKSINTLREDRYFKSWIYRISINEARTFLRRQKPRRWLSLEEHEHVLVTEEEREAFALLEVQTAEAELLKLALDHVSPMYRACLLLSILEGLPQREIADFLGIPKHNVSKNIDRGMMQLMRAYSYLDQNMKVPSKRRGM